ncbi:MAG TPA: hypothetical protein VM347_14340, partial [Nonomuraea sp.]|nr:hypothetical protein [Nonomuraea sp.]
MNVSNPARTGDINSPITPDRVLTFPIATGDNVAGLHGPFPPKIGAVATTFSTADNALVVVFTDPAPPALPAPGLAAVTPPAVAPPAVAPPAVAPPAVAAPPAVLASGTVASGTAA